MKKYLNLAAATVLFVMLNSTVLKAGLVDELKFVNEKSDFYSYINFSRIIGFISSKGIDIKELDAMVTEGSGNETDRIIQSFGLKFSDIHEFLMVMNTQDVEKKSGYLVFISFKDGKGIIPDEFKKNPVKLKSGTAYKASADEDIIFTKINDFFVIGATQYVEAFIDSRSLKKAVLSPGSLRFIKKANLKSMFFQLTVSEYIKTAMNSAMNSGAGMARGLKENVFVQTLLSLESMDWGMEINDKIIILSGMQGSKIEDSERLQMLCHTWIVGSSFIVSFADLMAARSGDQTLNELTGDQQLMSWMQKIFGRIHVKQEDKGVVISFEMNPAETDLMISFVKKEMEKGKKARIERLEREKISKLTLAVTENNIDKVQNYIKEKYNLNALDTDGNTPLCAAAVQGNVKIARLLIEKGAALEFPDVDKQTPLHQAVKNGKIENITLLLSKGSNVNAKADSDMTTLHINAVQGNSEITRILLAKGALVNAVDSGASTPLHYAASSGFIDIVKVLVDKKADAELLNSSGQRAIDAAAQNGQTAVVEFLKFRFKQEPKDSSFEENDLNEDFNMDEDSSSIDENSGDKIIDEDID